jgi:hypothetical protein
MVREATKFDSKERKESTGQQRIFFPLLPVRERERGCTGEKEREGKGEHVAAGERKRERGGEGERKNESFCRFNRVFSISFELV